MIPRTSTRNFVAGTHRTEVITPGLGEPSTTRFYGRGAPAQPQLLEGTPRRRARVAPTITHLGCLLSPSFVATTASLQQWSTSETSSAGFLERSRTLHSRLHEGANGAHRPRRSIATYGACGRAAVPRCTSRPLGTLDLRRENHCLYDG